MESLRFKAIESSIKRMPVDVKAPSAKISDYFGSNVFDKHTMQKYLSKEPYKEVMAAVPKHPKAPKVLTSAKTPAPPEGSKPAIESVTSMTCKRATVSQSNILYLVG